MIFSLLMLVLSLPLLAGDDITVLKKFQNPTEVGDDFFSQAYSMDFGPDGSLYVLDQRQNMVLVWSKGGSYKHSFGRKGEGPGELNLAMKLGVFQDTVVIWEHRQRMQLFGLNGKYKRTIATTGIQPRQMAFLNADTPFVGYQKLLPNGEMNLVFSLLNKAGNVTETFFRSLEPGGHPAPLSAVSQIVPKNSGV